MLKTDNMKNILFLIFVIFICSTFFLPIPAAAREIISPDPRANMGNAAAAQITVTSAGPHPVQPLEEEYLIHQESQSTANRFENAAAPAEVDALAAFAESVKDESRTGLITGVFAPGAFAAPVIQQPYNNPIYVSRQPGEVTQFRTAQRAGSIGLLAHNYLLGRDFFQLEVGSRLHIVYASGRIKAYQVYAIKDYQALSLYTFRELGAQNSIGQYPLFEEIYRAENDRLVLQTCIERGGNLSWGRRFILARPVLPAELRLEQKEARLVAHPLP
jgi:hypothetical protein